MKTLVSVKKDMEVNSGMALLIETLKTIAISQYYASQKRLKSSVRFFESIEAFTEAIDLNKIEHSFIYPKTQAQAIVAVTSDAGFLGGLNMRIISAALSEAKKMSTTIIIIGERGVRYVRGTNFSSVSFPGIRDEVRFSQAMQVRDYIYKKALAGEFGTIKVVYPRAASLGVQKIEIVSFLPFHPANAGAKPAGQALMADVIFESRPKDIFEYLVYLWMGVKLYDIFGLSRVAEFSARYFHLEESGEKLKEEDKKVKLQYFRIRHELADRSIRELVAGRFVRGKK